MKIGLLSPYHSQNHGTVLQAYALAKVIQDLGHECEYINCGLYRPSKNRVVERIKSELFPLLHPKYRKLLKENKEFNSKGLDYSFLGLPEFKAIMQRNLEFVKANTPVSRQWVAISKLNETPYDKFIVGSDQTWSPNLLYQFSPYYLQGVTDSCRKNAYACSMGRTSDFPRKYIEFLKESLSSFSMLSCREKSNCEMLSQVTGKEVNWVVDPALLLDRKQWQLLMKPVDIPDKFIVCYILGERDCIGKYADELGRREGLPVYYIMTRPSSCNHKNVLKDIGAAEFLWLIDHCHYLVTDSFHGCIFSINFQKNVMAFSKLEGNLHDNARIYDVLSSFGMESHYLCSDQYVAPPLVDYSEVGRKLTKRRQDSLNYLKQILS